MSIPREEHDAKISALEARIEGRFMESKAHNPVDSIVF